MSEEIVIVQSIVSGNEFSDYCLDDKGNVYKIESGQKNELTLVKQIINIFYTTTKLQRMDVSKVALLMVSLYNPCSSMTKLYFSNCQVMW